jgi:hypothetical protein
MDEGAKTANPLESMLSDPSLLAGLLSTPAKGESGDAHEKSPAASDGLSSLLSNPDLLAKLPAMVSMLKPMLQGLAEKPLKEDTKGDAGSTPSARESTYDKRRNDLLLALKPFLSKERCEAVDMILRLSTLGNVLRHLQQ